MATTPLNIKALPELLSQLVTPERIFFPVRHHSPACAWHLAKLIREKRPATILIEGPADFTSLISLLLNPATRTPFAVYTNFIDQENRTGGKHAAKNARLDTGPPRFAAYYPFCDYSPELVALREGAKAQADLRFIDLNYPDQVMAEEKELERKSTVRVESLLEERHLKRSAYLQALAQRTGCRDQNDLWDHLFEVNYDAWPAEQFIHHVATYCFMARVGVTEDELKVDGTLRREAAMASAVQAALKGRPAGKLILVVTGGFHTVALPAMLNGKLTAPKPVALKANASQTVLIRYSFDQLDTLNGYSAGMPAPFYYDQFWQEAAKGRGCPFTETAAKVLVELGRMTRAKDLAIALSPADEIAALEQACLLAGIRGHPGPSREDLLDGVRSCFVKGAMDAEGVVLLGLAQRLLAGNRIGNVPPEAGVPPIVDNFRQLAAELRLNISDSLARQAALEIYRKTAHRKISRLFHSLNFLAVMFARLEAGPDFVRGTGLERLQEHWEYQWSPHTESGLVEASVYGSTIEEAAANRLLEAIGELENQGKGRNAAEAVAMLVHACRMGLHPHTPRLLALIAGNISEDPDFSSLAQAMNQLMLLWQSREPLEAHRLTEVPALIQAAYQRACFLAQNLANTPSDALDATLAALNIVRGILVNYSAELLEADLYWQALDLARRQINCPTLLRGGAVGLLYGAARLTDNALVAEIAGHLGAATGAEADKVGFLRGLLFTCRELAWRQPALAQAVNHMLRGWDEDDFLRVLPHLRLAFAGLTPRETDQVAGMVAGMLGVKEIGPLVHYDTTEEELQHHLLVTAAVRDTLKRDHLESWLSELA